MARKFRGEGTCKVDAKGRFTLPPLFRRALEEGDPNFPATGRPELVILYGDETQDHLACYSLEGIEKVEADIDALEGQPELKEALQLLVSGYSLQTDVDGEGRLLLTPKLRDKLKIDAEVYVIASGDHFKIWREDVFRAQKPASLAELAGLPPGTKLIGALDAALARQKRG